MRMRSVALAFLTSSALFGCGPTAGGTGDDGDDDDSDLPDGGVRPDSRPQSWPDGGDGDSARCEKIDLLFVIDNSASMDLEQANLGTNFPAFISVIDESGLDYRVAVTTTGMDYTYYLTTPFGSIPSSQDGGDNGTMLLRDDCGMQRRWIEKTDADPTGTFACAANVGAAGPSQEMPLAAMRAALEDRMADGTNQGWRRPDALLGVVFLTDENDCSYEQSVTFGLNELGICESQMEPVPNYVSFLDAYTGDRGRWAVAAIAGPGPDTCESDFGQAVYAERIDQFVTQTGANGVLSSICSGDLTTGLADALAVFSEACDDFPPID